ncbi:hypothetical protein SCLCIDRAFT_34847 [Scleroderma citrinum Foug A]|uniref:Uncharacterized protein n=1 Tax=Scleroderma citrinum Foug A TaxID=1036808 RepID=A0A0C2YJN0_9AGAM|nr:hypothetical protein SCLCIDRAFT_34847 [Scleroderma citrinum Foug A]
MMVSQRAAKSSSSSSCCMPQDPSIKQFTAHDSDGTVFAFVPEWTRKASRRIELFMPRPSGSLTRPGDPFRRALVDHACHSSRSLSSRTYGNDAVPARHPHADMGSRRSGSHPLFPAKATHVPAIPIWPAATVNFSREVRF